MAASVSAGRISSAPDLCVGAQRRPPEQRGDMMHGPFVHTAGPEHVLPLDSVQPCSSHVARV